MQTLSYNLRTDKIANPINNNSNFHKEKIENTLMSHDTTIQTRDTHVQDHSCCGGKNSN
jgi:hypothetical protein